MSFIKLAKTTNDPDPCFYLGLGRLWMSCCFVFTYARITFGLMVGWRNEYRPAYIIICLGPVSFGFSIADEGKTITMVG